MKKFRIAVLVSGRGSNLEAIIKAVKSGYLGNIAIALVVSDNKNAKALDICRRHGIKALYVNPGNFKSKLEGAAQDEYIEIIRNAKPDLVVLAGFMRILKDKFINSFPDSIINIHPSLLPKYPGLHTHKRALEAGDRFAGCTVHYVDESVDGGKIIMQARVPILPGDDEEKLAARVLEIEHLVLPETIKLLAEKNLKAGGPIIYGE
jgi:phosphoribosylglycinamide formyltransferase-1